MVSRISACCLAIVLCTAAGLAQDSRPSPLFTGAALPVPPQQLLPWTPPATTLPPALIDATQMLFAQGLADPRGCEYREIDVGTGNCWRGDGGVQRVHGWVLPQQGEATQRFAICWNGLVYPVVTLGPQADINLDFKELAGQHNGANRVIPEGVAISVQSPLPIKACLLLRLGEEGLARHIWTDGKPAADAAAKGIPTSNWPPCGPGHASTG